MICWQAKYLKEKEKNKKLMDLLHSQAEELARCYVEIVELKEKRR